MEMAVFWDGEACSLVNTDRRFRRACLIILMMEAVSSSKKSVNIYQTSRCNIPKDSHLPFDLYVRIGPQSDLKIEGRIKSKNMSFKRL
jgi:hypothetical protein